MDSERSEVNKPQKGKINRGNTSCCVVGCSNSYRNTTDIIFYTFPHEKWHRIRREKWIQAVHRINPDKSNWLPKKWDRVCSIHFVGGKKADNPASPSYVPSLHLGRKQGAASSGHSSKRFERAKQRAKKKSEQLSVLPMELENDQPERNQSHEIGIQVDIVEDRRESPADPIHIFVCIEHGNDIQTQVNIPAKHSVSVQVGDASPKMKDSGTCTSTDDENCNNSFTGFDSVKNDGDSLREFTGVTLTVFYFLLNFISPNSSLKFSLNRENRLFLFLMKMKLGLHYTILGTLFGIHRTTASRYFKQTLQILYDETKSLIKLHYPNCTAIIDCTEIFCERPGTVSQRVLTFSSYKSNFTLKYLIGIIPSGFICFISCGYGGRSSDSFITVNSGILKYIKPGDEIMSDKGFPLIKTCLNDYGAVLVMPPIAHRNGEQFTMEECEDTYNIAQVRIHVERVIQRIKLCEILDKFTNDLIPEADKIVHLAAVLTNLQPPIIK